MEKCSSRDYQIQLRNLGGIPVIEIMGEINRTSLEIIEAMIAALEKAGHYNIVVNIKRALAANFNILSFLSNSVSQIRGHYGNIDLVAETTQIKQMANDGLAHLFRMCISESQAIGRIKRLLRPPDDVALGTPARIMEPEWPNESQN